MLSVQIVCVGKLKEAYWRDACAEYAKRMAPFCRFRITELDEARGQEGASPAQIDDALRQEGARLRSHTPPSSWVAAMCIEATPQPSEGLAAKLASLTVRGVSSVAFWIGGSWGLAPELKRTCDCRISMSPMTFPHQLARVMLCEQLYRACQINAGGKYHK